MDLAQYESWPDECSFNFARSGACARSRCPGHTCPPHAARAPLRATGRKGMRLAKRAPVRLPSTTLSLAVLAPSSKLPAANCLGHPLTETHQSSPMRTDQQVPRHFLDRPSRHWRRAPTKTTCGGRVALLRRAWLYRGADDCCRLGPGQYCESEPTGGRLCKAKAARERLHACLVCIVLHIKCGGPSYMLQPRGPDVGRIAVAHLTSSEVGAVRSAGSPSHRALKGGWPDKLASYVIGTNKH